MNWKFLESLTTPDDIPLIIGENPCQASCLGLHYYLIILGVI